MSCQSSKCGSNSAPTLDSCKTNHSFNFVIIVVLYILLAIIIGSWVAY